MRVKSGPVDCCASVALSLEVQFSTYMLLYSVTEGLRDWLDTRQRRADENWSRFAKITIKKAHKHVFAKCRHLHSYSN
jgi:hypothetical protein